MIFILLVTSALLAGLGLFALLKKESTSLVQHCQLCVTPHNFLPNTKRETEKKFRVLRFHRTTAGANSDRTKK